YRRQQDLEPAGETLDRFDKVHEWSEDNSRKFEILHLSAELHDTNDSALNHRNHRRDQHKYLHEACADDSYETCFRRYRTDDGLGNESERFTNELNYFSAANELGSQVQEACDVVDNV